MNKPLRIALFGFGRIGRNIFRIGFNNPLFEFVAISDLGQPESMHYLLMRDSIHGTMSDEIKLDGLWIPTTYPNKKETIVVLHGLTASYREFNVL